MTASDSRQLIAKALKDVAEGRAGRAQSPQAEATQRRAQELQAELQGRQQPRPGVLAEAQATVEEFLRLVGRLGPAEQLTDSLNVQVKLTDGGMKSVSVQRQQLVRQLREKIGGHGGLIMSGRPLQDETPLWDLWLREGLGCSAAANPPFVQVVVQNVGG